MLELLSQPARCLNLTADPMFQEVSYEVAYCMHAPLMRGASSIAKGWLAKLSQDKNCQNSAMPFSVLWERHQQGIFPCCDEGNACLTDMAIGNFWQA